MDISGVRLVSGLMQTFESDPVPLNGSKSRNKVWGLGVRFVTKSNMGQPGPDQFTP